jgi:hypothetical protein
MLQSGALCTKRGRPFIIAAVAKIRGMIKTLRQIRTALEIAALLGKTSKRILPLMSQNVSSVGCRRQLAERDLAWLSTMGRRGFAAVALKRDI